MRSLLSSIALLCLIACKSKKSEGEKIDKHPDSTNQPESIKDDPAKNNSIVGIWGPSELNMKQEMSEEEKTNILENATIEFTAAGKEERFSVVWDNGLLRLTMEDGTMVLKRK
jgi:hypothetical protein